MKSLLFFLLILASGYWCYENYGQNVPVRTVLSHVDGRSMDVVISSRSQSQVNFQRSSDGKSFSCGIRDLSLISKCKVYWYFRPTSARSGAMGNGSDDVGDLHLSGMREEMDKLKEELSLARYRLPASETNAQRRTVENEIDALELKQEQLEYKMAKYQSGK